MVRVDMNAPVPGSAPDGVYIADVAKAKATLTKGGDPAINLEFGCSYGGTVFKVYDTIMLNGRGWSLGRPKLTALGVPSEFSGDLDPADLLGRRVYLHLAFQEYQGKRSLKPDPKQGSHSGYSLETDADAKAKADATAATSQVQAVDEAPF